MNLTQPQTRSIKALVNKVARHNDCDANEVETIFKQGGDRSVMVRAQVRISGYLTGVVAFVGPRGAISGVEYL